MVEGPIHWPEVLISTWRWKQNPCLGHPEICTADSFLLNIQHLSGTYNEPGIMLGSKWVSNRKLLSFYYHRDNRFGQQTGIKNDHFQAWLWSNRKRAVTEDTWGRWDSNLWEEGPLWTNDRLIALMAPIHHPPSVHCPDHGICRSPLRKPSINTLPLDPKFRNVICFSQYDTRCDIP